MNRKRLSSGIALVLLAAILGSVPRTLACGPFTLSAVFSFSVHPEYPLERFAAGDLGVLQPAYARSYLYVAFRHLSDAGFSKESQQRVVELWHDRLDLKWPSDGEEGVQVWLTARAKVPGISAAPKIEVYRNREKPNEYETYLNCQNDAFRTASATLAARIDKFGAEHPAIRDWVAAQDLVFANCSEGKQIPEPATPDADTLMKTDRTYQIAAANFYAGAFADARSLFKTIAQDQTSPWRAQAPYLVARTLVREASLNAPENKAEPLGAAEKQLNAILNDPTQREIHEASRRLLGLVRLRLYPEERVRELAQALMSQTQDKSIKQNLWDYTVLLDQLLGDDGEGPRNELSETLRADELTDWVVTFQTQTQKALDHSIERWQARRSTAWLIAVLSKIDQSHRQVNEILRAAAAISPDSPAFPSVTFHTVRLSVEAGRYDDARAMLDDVLNKHRNRLTASGLNLALSQRMALSRTLEDFLTYAQRVPAAFSYDDDGREIPTEESEDSEETPSMRGKALIDVDAAYLLNQKMPVALLKQAVDSRTLQPHLRRDVAQAAWLRSVLLDDSTTAEALVPTLKSLAPEMSNLLDDYLRTKQPDRKRFTGIYIWLKLPGLEPVVDAGVGRSGSYAVQDSYRDNWWCRAAYATPAASSSPTESSGQEILKIKTTLDLIRDGSVPLFLTDAERAVGEKEFAAISALGAAPNYLSREAIQWATKSSADPRVPEALHLAVKTTRFGCTDKQSARWSKAAFDLLHRRYPTSVWAKRTPYWFKD